MTEYSATTVGSPRICVIGAGPCGLTTIKNLLATGIDEIVCYDERDAIGGRARGAAPGTVAGQALRPRGEIAFGPDVLAPCLRSDSVLSVADPCLVTRCSAAHAVPVFSALATVQAP